MLHPAPLPPCPTSEVDTVLASRPLIGRRRVPPPQLPLALAVCFAGAMIAMAVAVVGLSAVRLARELAEPAPIVAAPPLPAPGLACVASSSP